MKLVKKWVIHVIALSVILFIGAIPVLVGLTGNLIAFIFDCRLNFAHVYPCVIGGHDYGQMLHNTGAGYWLAILSVPIASIVIVVYLLILFLAHLPPPKDSTPKNSS